MTIKQSMPIRFSILYFLFFLMIGTYGPFWPVWLLSINFSPQLIATALALATIFKIIIGPLFASLNDKHNNNNVIIFYISLLSTLTFFSILLLSQNKDSSKLLIVILGCLAWGLFSSTLPLLEAKTLLITQKKSLDYGKIRLWGSISFIIAALVVGFLIENTNKNIIIILVLIFSFITTIAVYYTPNNKIKNKKQAIKPFYSLIKTPNLLLVFLCCGFIQASHSFYYAFSSIEWLKNGLSSSFIGFCWALGVFAEIILFAFFANKLKTLSPKILLKFAAIITIFRWIILSLSSSPLWIIIAQLGHAGSYGITHLAAIYFISKNISKESQTSAQSIYASISMGIFPAIFINFCGILYSSGEANLGYLCMTILAVTGFLLSSKLKP